MDRWLEKQDRESARLILVHGDDSRLEQRQECLQQEDGLMSILHKREKLYALNKIMKTRKVHYEKNCC